MKNISKKYKKGIVILVAIKLIGLTVHSALLLFLNKNFPPEMLDYTIENVAIEKRFFLRGLAEKTNGICDMIFILGCILMLYHLAKSSMVISFRKIFWLFLGVEMTIVICIVPFASIDKKFTGDYIFPIWVDLIIVTILFCVLLGVNIAKKYKLKQYERLCKK